MTSVFERFNGYGFVHHRALNSHAVLRETLELVARHPGRTHILEGDLCWDFSPGEELFYFRHPSYVVDVLSPREIHRGFEQGTLTGLNDLTKVRESGAFLVIELKVGKGGAKPALGKIVAYLEENFRDRYWIDGFSLPMLEYIKKISPRTSVTLHTECVYQGRVLIGAPEWPPVRVRKLSKLPAIDGVVIRKRGGDGFMAKACADVRSANKVLALSRLHGLEDFKRSMTWGARAGYLHRDIEEILGSNDRAGKKTSSGMIG